MTTDTQDSAAERRRKRLIRIVVVLAIAVPIVIEGLTFGGLLSSTLLGGGGGDGGTASPSETTTTEGVGVGDELLAATPQRETIRTASLAATGDTWTLTLSVAVNNTENSSYQFQLGAIETADGRTVSNSASVTVPPGETETVTGQWALPAGDRPRTVQVLAVRDVGGNASTVGETVRLAPIPVQGQ